MTHTQELLRYVKNIKGPKVILVEDNLFERVNTVDIRANEDVHLIKLSDNSDLGDIDTLVYVVRPELHLMEAIATQVKQRNTNRNSRFHLLFVTYRSTLCERYLEQRGVRGSFCEIIDLQWNMPTNFVMFPHLHSEHANLQLLQECACADLLDQLKNIEGTKALLIEQSLLGAVDLVAAPKVFTDHNIRLLTFKADTKSIAFPNEVTNIIYLLRPQMQLMETIVGHLLQYSGAKSKREFHLFFVPRQSCLCEKYLEEKGVREKIKQIRDVRWNFLPVDADVISMEMPMAFREMSIDGVSTALYQAALGLVELQRLYGRIPKIYGKGNHSKQVWLWAKQIGAEEKSLLHGDKGAFDQLILLDRSIDVMSALATQLTYEGLIDEFYGIEQNKVALPAHIIPDRTGGIDAAVGSSSGKERKNIVLNSTVKLYAEIRDKHFNEVLNVLTRNAKEIRDEFNTIRNEQQVKELKNMVDKLPALNSLKEAVSLHNSIAESIQKQVLTHDFTDDLNAEQEFMVGEDIDKPSAYIEDLMAKKKDLRNVLRLICMQCAAASGLKEKVLNYYKRELAHIYGVEILLVLSNLEKAGLLHTQSESRPYLVLRKSLNLTVDDVAEVDPKDITYVHSFYAPLTVRIVEQTLKPLGWATTKSKIAIINDETVDDFQRQLIGIGGRYAANTSTAACGVDAPRVVLVFFVGGCTFAEIAALRFLAQQEDNKVKFLIATTNIINKNSFLDTFMHGVKLH